MNRVVLSKEEGQWLTRNIIKTKMILEAASQKDPGILERNTYRTLAALAKKAKEAEGVLVALKEEPFELEMFFSQKQKVVLKDLIEKTHLALTETILPEYEKRGLVDYAEDTTRKLALLKSLERKLK